MKTDIQMCCAKIVREVMKANGRNIIFNNIYYSGTRTVKCYVPRDEFSRNKLQTEIRAVLDALKCQCYIIKQTQGRSFGGSGFIVKFPAQN